MDTPTDPMDIARARIAEEAERQTGTLDLGGLGLTELPPEISALTHLVFLNLGVHRVSADGSYDEYDRRGFPNSIADLSPIHALTALQTLICSGTSIADLTPLAGLTGLQTLNCAGTSIADLTPLAGLTGLQTLNCSETSVADLTPLAGLTALQELRCWHTSVADLAPLAGLTGLQKINCSITSVADLAPLAGLTALQTLDCAGTSVADLAPLAGLTALQTLNCASTPVADLAPLAGLTALQTLNCASTPVADLAPLAGLPNLRHLYALRCQLKSPPSRFWHKPSLEEVFLYSAALPGIPAEVLSSHWVENCLPRLRAHLDDLEAGDAPMTDVKLLVLGNGRAGKTQLVRRLCGPEFAYQPEWDSTHGVQVATALLDSEATNDPTRLHIWDFGGQDIYHGTHALFTRARAIFAVVWASDTEKTAEYERDGIRFRNHPLPYWVSYVRNNGGADSPLLIVQAKCDTQADERRRLPLDDALLNALPYAKALHYSAAKDRGRAALNEALADAVAWLHSPERLGAPLIGRGRLQVQRRLESLRDADAARPPAERQHRTVSQAFFHELCDEAGGVSNPALFLEYLNNCGVVFHRPGLFGDAIVLDQAWALDAIYAVFERDKCYRHLRAIGGRFTRLLLDAMVWSEFAREEQQLFLSMMRTSGICFPHRPGATRDDDETEYIAPDLLPERAAVQTAVDALWDETAPSEVATYRYAFTHPGLIRALIARIGSEAGINAVYWQGGVALYEASTRSRARLDYAVGDDWSATLSVRTQTGRASELLNRLCEWVEKEQTGLGIAPTERPEHRKAVLARRSRAVAESLEAVAPAEPPLVFTAPPVAGPQWYVSYAWGDSSPEGIEREAIVDQLCERATELGKSIQRDKSDLRTGDSIAKFMGRIGRGDRVFVILSKKYLHSPFCMFELFEVWRTSQQDPDIFRRRVRVYKLPDAEIFTTDERMRIAEYWMQQRTEREARIRNHSLESVAVKDFQQFTHIAKFARGVAEILCGVAEINLPRTLDELVAYGLEDTP
jgi:internalin A